MGTAQSKESAIPSASSRTFTTGSGQRKDIDIIVTQGNTTTMFTTLPLRRSTSEGAPDKTMPRSSLKRKSISSDFLTASNLRSSTLPPRRAKTPSSGQSPTLQSRTSTFKQTSVTTKVVSPQAAKSLSNQQTTSPRTPVKSVVSSKIQKVRATSPAVKSIIRMHPSPQRVLKGSTLSGGLQNSRGLISPISKSRVAVTSRVVSSPLALSKLTSSPRPFSDFTGSPRVHISNKVSLKTPSSPLKFTPLARPTVKSIASPSLQQVRKTGSPVVKSAVNVTPQKTSVSRTPVSLTRKRKSISPGVKSRSLKRSPSHSTPKRSRASPNSKKNSTSPGAKSKKKSLSPSSLKRSPASLLKKKLISPGSSKAKSPVSAGKLKKLVTATPPGGKSRIVASSKVVRSPHISLKSIKVQKTSPKTKVKKISPVKSSPARTPASPRLQKFKIRTSPLKKSVLKLTPSKAASSPRTPLSAKLQKNKATSVKKSTPKTSPLSKGKNKVKRSPVVKLKSPKRSPVKTTPKKKLLSPMKKKKISPSKLTTKVVSPGALKKSATTKKAKSPLGKVPSLSARPKASPMKSPLKKVILIKKRSPPKNIKAKPQITKKSPVSNQKSIAKIVIAGSQKKSPSPQKLQMSPTSQKTSPRSQKSSPKSQKTSPKSQTKSPISQKISPKLQSKSPKSQTMSPKLQKVSLNSQNVSPKTKPASPQNQSVFKTKVGTSATVKSVLSKPKQEAVQALTISALKFYSSPTSSNEAPSQVHNKSTLKINTRPLRVSKINKLAATRKSELKSKLTSTGASSSPYAKRIAPLLDALKLRANRTPIPFMQPCSVLLNSSVVKSYFQAKAKKQMKRVRFQLVKTKRLQPKPVPVQEPSRRTRNNPTGRQGRRKLQPPPKTGSSRGGR